MTDRRPRRRLQPRAWQPLAVVIGVVLAVGGCGDDDRDLQAFGDAANGRELFVDYGCASCHQVSGVRQAVGRVGPNLDDFATQRIIAGVLPNTPGHLAAWIQDPAEYAPNTGMPDVGVTPPDAADISAFLLEGG